MSEAEKGTCNLQVRSQVRDLGKLSHKEQWFQDLYSEVRQLAEGVRPWFSDDCLNFGSIILEAMDEAEEQPEKACEILVSLRNHACDCLRW